VGVLIPLFSLRRFSFTSLAASTSAEVVMVRAVDIRDFRELTVLLRVHARTIDSGCTISLLVLALSQTPENPGVDFLDSSTSIATATIIAGTTSTLVVKPVTTTFGGLARVVVKGARAASGTCTADFAADLLLRE
jgi:hypothetical protein